MAEEVEKTEVVPQVSPVATDQAGVVEAMRKARHQIRKRTE
jgi:hypothetical protein